MAFPHRLRRRRLLLLLQSGTHAPQLDGFGVRSGRSSNRVKRAASLDLAGLRRALRRRRWLLGSVARAPRPEHAAAADLLPLVEALVVHLLVALHGDALALVLLLDVLLDCTSAGAEEYMKVLESTKCFKEIV